MSKPSTGIRKPCLWSSPVFERPSRRCNKFNDHQLPGPAKTQSMYNTQHIYHLSSWCLFLSIPASTSTSSVTVFPPTAYDNFFSKYHQPNQIPSGSESESLVQDNKSALHAPDTLLVVNPLNTLQNVANAARLVFSVPHAPASFNFWNSRHSHPMKRKDPPVDEPRRSKVRSDIFKQ